MNEKVKELGLNNTHFSNAIGKDENNYSSMYDVSKILEYALMLDIIMLILMMNLILIPAQNLLLSGFSKLNSAKKNRSTRKATGCVLSTRQPRVHSALQLRILRS